jgi:hypothetical protein
VAFGTISFYGDSSARPYALHSNGNCIAPTQVSSDYSYMAAPAPSLSTPAPVSNCAIDGQNVYCQGYAGRVFIIPLTDGGWGAPVSVQSDAGVNATFPGFSLFTDGVRRLALGGGPQAKDMRFFTPDASNPATSTFETTSTGIAVGQSAVLDAEHIWASSDRGPPTIDLFSSDGGVVIGPRVAGGIYAIASPVLGKGSLGYVADLDGGLTVFSTSKDGGGGWSDGIGSGQVVAAPALDCLRDGADAGLGAKFGVLYVATMNGTVVAIVVDSPGLDPNAQWPKYQRDATNSGNASLGLPLNPGCP